MNKPEIIGIAGAGLVILAMIGLKYSKGNHKDENTNEILDLLKENENQIKTILAENKGKETTTDIAYLKSLEEQRKKERANVDKEYDRSINRIEKRIKSVSHFNTTNRLKTLKQRHKPDYEKEVHETIDMIWEDRNARGKGKIHGTKKKRSKKK